LQQGALASSSLYLLTRHAIPLKSYAIGVDFMSITHPQPQKANRSPRPVLAPTPKLRAQAAIGEAIAAFKDIARSAGMIGIFLIMMSSASLSGLDRLGLHQYFFAVILSLLVVSLSLSFATIDLTPASKRAKYFSGVDENQRWPSLWGWVRWVAFGGAIVLGLAILHYRDALGMPFNDAQALFCSLMIVSQLIAILIDMPRGVKLLRFAQEQREDLLQPQVGERHH
jgi:hypothetical protein